MSSQPQAASKAGRSSPLRDLVIAEIERDGPIPFSRYMELCLYSRELGYYARAREQFGKAGDFYTSSDVHAVYGRLLARQFEQMWQLMDAPDRLELIELGPGRGLFAQDVLDWATQRFSDFSDCLQYRLVEQSSRLRERLGERLSEHISSGRGSVYDSLESAASKAGSAVIVFGNEFFDALPVELIDHRGSVRVGFEDGRFVETFAQPTSDEMEFLDRYGVHPGPSERVEVSLLALEWIGRIAKVLEDRRGFLIFVDYGYTREQQLTGRHRNTLMTYRQHQASANPYEAPGEQDITAHVNFTALRSRGAECGLDDLGLLTQSQFLIGIGEESEFSDVFGGCVLPQERAKVALQLKHLISPEGMGETFQVLLMSKEIGKEKAATLSGLKWMR